ncbi:hypothetical protein EVAR_84764_1 [Eumeta japonica]|uniref:Kazal-like domain-containing protein n=1 Tax=Eumeta variegata TaxID=151549 RepID=A0A4C1U8T0_EUMVA|nr:hypothetical protein EVAR_84764_1 [Eumeta japonica]
MELLRTKRQSNGNENAGNTLEDRYGVIIRPEWRIWFHPLPPFPGQNPSPTITITTTTTERSTGNSTLTLQRCMRNCPVTPEYNPVCGTDNKKYDNPGLLSCAQACGVRQTIRSGTPNVDKGVREEFSSAKQRSENEEESSNPIYFKDENL